MAGRRKKRLKKGPKWRSYMGLFLEIGCLSMLQALNKKSALINIKARLRLWAVWLAGGALLLSSCTNKKPPLKINRSETFFYNLGSEPENLHPIRSTDVPSSIVQGYIMETLLQRNKDTYEWEPSLAKKWEVSPDGRTFTFELHKGLKWPDGRSLTAQDVKFSFEAYRSPKYGGIRYLPYFEKMDSAHILDDKRIQFKVKEPYFKNFDVIAGMLMIIPEPVYKDPKKKLPRQLAGSGPYILDRYIKGKLLVLRKNPLWAGKNHPVNKNKWLFKTLVFRFVKTEADALLRMEKEQLDFNWLSPESFFEKTKKEPWGVKIKKIQFQNQQPAGYSYIGFNLKKPLFQDRRTRKALAHLFNRQLMNQKFNYNQRELARGPWYFWSDYADPKIPAIKFNPKKATSLLKSAGWRDEDKNGILEKTINGIKTELAWTIIYSNPDSEKYLTLYQEDLKQAGIKLSLKTLDWASFLRLIDDKNFDAVMLGWLGSAIDFDPKQLWHSASSQNKGSNFISYSNPQVDAWIDKGRALLSRPDRIKAFRKVYRLIAQDAPYIFLFHGRKKFYGVNKRIKTPASAFNYGLGLPYWSFQAPLLKNP